MSTGCVAPGITECDQLISDQLSSHTSNIAKGDNPGAWQIMAEDGHTKPTVMYSMDRRCHSKSSGRNHGCWKGNQREGQLCSMSRPTLSQGIASLYLWLVQSGGGGSFTCTCSNNLNLKDEVMGTLGAGLGASKHCSAVLRLSKWILHIMPVGFWHVLL